MEIMQAEKQLELDRKANYKQGGEQRMRKPGKHLLFTDQRTQIVESWDEKYAFSRGAGDEMAHADCRDNHCMSVYDSYGFETELGEPAEDRRDTLAPGCRKGLALMGITGAVVLTRPTGLRNELLHYYSRQSGGVDGLLRTRLPCNVTGVKKLVCSMEWDHIEAKANGGEDVPENLHLISARLNATIGDANTREWALANGYGPLKVEPPSASALAQSLLLPSWNGRDVTAETTLRLARARIEILAPWEGVLGAIRRKAKRTGQSVLDFPRVAPAPPAAPAAPVAPVAPAAPTNNATCHYRRCSAVVLDAAGHPLPGQGVKAGKSVYCTPHAAQHLATLQRKRDARRAKHGTVICSGTDLKAPL